MKSNITKLVEKNYDNIADAYTRVIDEKAFNAHLERPAMLKLIGDVRGKKVLEPGCGSGFYTAYFADNGAEVFAFDVSTKMIEFTKKRVGNSLTVKIVKENLDSNLDFVQNDYYDMVMGSLVFHYIEDFDKLFQILGKKLKSGGELIFSTHHPANEMRLFDPDIYFDTELIDDSWQFGNKKYKMTFYRRPLEKIIMPLINSGFTITDFVEMQPTEKFAERNPEAYSKVMKYPWFLGIKAKKV